MIQTALGVLLWLGIFTLFYSYLGYALLTLILTKLSFKKRLHQIKDFEPPVTLIIAAYNEESIIEDKIANTFALDYPKDKLEILFVTDGSNDRTAAIVSGFAGVKLLHRDERLGKSAALNRAVPLATHDIVIICDANTMLNTSCVRELVKYYADETVGGVSGEKKVLSAGGVVQQEGLYWKYESTLKKIDAGYQTVVGAAGELFSFRKKLWTTLEQDTLLDDFMVSMHIVMKRYRVLYEPAAYAFETASATVTDEAKRKVRIAAGGFQSISRLLPMLNIFKYTRASLLYISHRVLRWAVCPFAMVFVLAANFFLVLMNGGLVYQLLLGAQLLFYGIALLYSFPFMKRIKMPLAPTVYYFVFMNVCVIRGFFRFLKGGQKATWEKATRQVMMAEKSSTVS